MLSGGLPSAPSALPRMRRRGAVCRPACGSRRARARRPSPSGRNSRTVTVRPKLVPDWSRTPEKARLYSEPEVHDVPVLDDVLLALQTQLPRLAALRLAA